LNTNIYIWGSLINIGIKIKNGEASFPRMFDLPLCLKVFLPVFLLVGLLVGMPSTANSDEQSVAVVVSARIRPYMQVLKGLEQGLESASLAVFYLDPSENNDRVSAILIKDEFDLFVAIGPEAGKLIWSLEDLKDRGKIYSAILDPNATLEGRGGECGVSLKIPVPIQLAEISGALPGVKKLGLLFDRTHNLPFFESAKISGKVLGIDLIALTVDSKKDIPDILKKHLSSLDCIWMVPDRTVISEKIVQYVIKQALYRKKGVIGYNSFFLKSGALFAFEFDYVRIGIQTSEMVTDYLNGSAMPCAAPVPFFDRGLNAKVARTIGFPVEE
jgi:putative ABC transport system substrate-binding protein